MKQMTSFRPANSSDALTISVTTEHANFLKANLKEIQPTKVWKSTGTTETTIEYDFGVGVTVSYNGAFINRINFAAFFLETSPDGITWTLAKHVTGLTEDELADENYVHCYVEITAVNYRYIRVRIPIQTPLFNTGYFQMGNFLIGNFTTIWNPKAGYSVVQSPKMALTEFRSGYISTAKLGKTRRIFSGNFDKFSKTEFDKIVQTYQPFVLYHEFDADQTSIYLVRSTKEFARDYFMAKTLNMSFSFEELV